MTEEQRSIHARIVELAEPLAVSLGLCLWGVEVAFGKRGLVRVFVDAPAGASDLFFDGASADVSGLSCGGLNDAPDAIPAGLLPAVPVVPTVPVDAVGDASDNPPAAFPDVSSPSAFPGASSVGSPADPATPGGVDIERCAELSRLLGMTLDVEDCMPGAYTLEVSSPGLTRTFFTEDQLAGAVGRTVVVRLHEPLPDLPGRKKLQGVLERAANGVFTLAAIDPAAPATAPAPVSFCFAQIKKAEQVHVPPEKVLPGKARNRQK